MDSETISLCQILVKFYDTQFSSVTSTVTRSLEVITMGLNPESADSNPLRCDRLKKDLLELDIKVKLFNAKAAELILHTDAQSELGKQAIATKTAIEGLGNHLVNKLIGHMESALGGTELTLTSLDTDAAEGQQNQFHESLQAVLDDVGELILLGKALDRHIDDLEQELKKLQPQSTN